ncbi:mannose-6-phosphate isomerase, class I [Brevibacterium sp. BRM-1]|uniref:mannose-6-phosphate isomerase, class I n=1 Tax=Brevibacterium sp. BRM-1 TaxID=2999062 RepID=UPI002280DF2C|nr:mannose-6-phosphate isomerase, class I [Brevibacterium sp. BRM-1]WAL40323.1 mannose-6-phosphate isomerase, class I [Brevibacterium sp. BRM-1]
MLRLCNAVRDYAWGDTRAIPRILGREPDGTPAAELWVGAHPGAPSTTADGPLDAVIAADPQAALGRASATAFGPQLPFLLKVLSAATALSIQVHPSREQAAAGWAREEAAGIARDAPERSYRDANHKPELVCALGDFDALCGFRPLAATRATIARLRSVAAGLPVEQRLLDAWADALAAPAEAQALRAAVELLLGRWEDYGALARTLAERIGVGSAADAAGAAAGAPGADAAPGADGVGAADGGSAPGAPAPAAVSADGSCTDPLETLRELSADFLGDPGALVALMLNRVRLREGQALFLDAGVPHAYLGGLAVEVMAASDNVLRGGLTAKHIDVAEMSAIVAYRVITPRVLAPDRRGVYPAPVPDFSLARVRQARGTALSRCGAAEVLCLDGEFVLSAGGEALTLRRGQSAFVPAAAPEVRLTGVGLLFTATTGLCE